MLKPFLDGIRRLPKGRPHHQMNGRRLSFRWTFEGTHPETHKPYSIDLKCIGPKGGILIDIKKPDESGGYTRWRLVRTDPHENSNPAQVSHVATVAYENGRRQETVRVLERTEKRQLESDIRDFFRARLGGKRLPAGIGDLNRQYYRTDAKGKRVLKNPEYKPVLTHENAETQAMEALQAIRGWVKYGE